MDGFVLFILIALVLVIVFVIAGFILSIKYGKEMKLRKDIPATLLNNGEISQEHYERLLKIIQQKTISGEQFDKEVIRMKEEMAKLKQEEERRRIAESERQQRILEYKSGLIKFFGEEIGMRLFNNESWIGMSRDMVIAMRGEPTKAETEVLKTKTKETLIYGNKSSGDYYVLENGVVTKIVDR